MRPGARVGGGSRFLYEPFDAREQEEREYREILRVLGTPEQIKAKVLAFEELLEEKKRRDWLFGAVRRAAAWAAVVAGGWLAFKGLLAEFMAGLE
jgi:hypothetical protein